MEGGGCYHFWMLLFLRCLLRLSLTFILQVGKICLLANVSLLCTPKSRRESTGRYIPAVTCMPSRHILTRHDVPFSREMPEERKSHNVAQTKAFRKGMLSSVSKTRFLREFLIKS